jgi:hypothetical protein
MQHDEGHREVAEPPSAPARGDSVVFVAQQQQQQRVALGS